jgi:hypothetical protein
MTFAMEVLARGDADRIIMFSDEASVVEDPRNYGVWKGTEQCDVSSTQPLPHWYLKRIFR